MADKATTPKTPATTTSADAPVATGSNARVAPIIATGTLEGFTPPAKTGRSGGGKAQYPFDDLAVGGYFSVKNKNARQMTGPLTTAHKRYKNEVKGADGAVVSKTQDREFYAVDVDADTAAKLVGTAHEGATVLLVRSK